MLHAIKLSEVSLGPVLREIPVVYSRENAFQIVVSRETAWSISVVFLFCVENC